jgi:hypothetical protein
MRRIFWVAVGLGAGVTAAVMVSRWVRRQRDRLSPSNLGGQLAEGTRDFRRLVREAIDEGRQAMVEKEEELKASLGGEMD